MLVSRSVVTLAGGRTSVRMEPLYWEALREIAYRQQCSLSTVVKYIEQEVINNPFPIYITTKAHRRGDTIGYRLTSLLRSFILDYFRRSATEYGHRMSGHGVYTPFLPCSGTEMKAEGEPPPPMRIEQGQYNLVDR